MYSESNVCGFHAYFCLKQKDHYGYHHCVCVCGGGGGGDGGRKFNCPGNITSNIAGMDVATIAEIFHTMAMGCLYIH